MLRKDSPSQKFAFNILLRYTILQKNNIFYTDLLQIAIWCTTIKTPINQGVLMLKLLNQFKASPSLSNRTKLQKYMNKHPFAVCLMLPEEVDFLKTHSFSI